MGNRPLPATLRGPEPEFFAAAAAGRLIIQRCDACGSAVFHPRVVCPECLSERLVWMEASGRGVVYSFTVVRRPPRVEFQELAAYVVALVDLEEGVRVLSNVVGCGPDDVTIGLAVVVRFEPAGDGLAAPVFAPAGEVML